jgi:hypothetical protein
LSRERERDADRDVYYRGASFFESGLLGEADAQQTANKQQTGNREA